MKRLLKWRLLIVVTGTLFGLLAGIGLSAPAVAAPVEVAAAAAHNDRGEELTLKVTRDGKLRVVGDDYDARKVYVKIVQSKDRGKDKVIDERYVRTHRGDFKFDSKKAKCGNEYRAYSHSKQDGWEKSNKIRIDCSKGGRK